MDFNTFVPMRRLVRPNLRKPINNPITLEKSVYSDKKRLIELEASIGCPAVVRFVNFAKKVFSQSSRGAKR